MERIGKQLDNLLNVISKRIYILLFCVFVIALSCASTYKLVDYYVKDTVVNNDSSSTELTRLESDQIANFFEEKCFIWLNGKMRTLLGQHEMNDIVKLNNGYLTETYPYLSDETIDAYANSIISVSNYLKSKGVAVIYVATPYTTSKFDSQLPIGVEDYGNENIDRFLSKLNSADVDNMDVRQMMYDDGINQYDMMYRTDHHWTTDAGYYVACKITNYLKDALKCEVDEQVLDKNNYNVLTYPKWNLGARGSRVGLGFTIPDDFRLYIPIFQTRIKHGEMVGNMQDVAYHMEYLENVNYELHIYDSVLWDVTDYYINEASLNDKKILFISDSFYRGVAPFVMMEFAETAYYYDLSSADITPQMLDSLDVDAVVFLYYSCGTIIENSEAFNFQGFN